MLSALPSLARDLGADERTLRRAVERGAVRCRRPGPRQLELDETERTYLVGHWSLLSDLSEALRCERNVRSAVLYGSVARGEEYAGSDVDVLVSLHNESLPAQADLETKLMDATGRDVQVIELNQALSDSPRLVLRALDEARVLADRDGTWAALRAKRRAVQAAARRQAHALEVELTRGRAGDDVVGRAGGPQAAGGPGGGSRHGVRSLTADERQDLIVIARAAVKDLPNQKRDLALALRAFTNANDFRAAWDAKGEDPAQAQRINLVSWGMSAIPNDLNTTLQTGVVLAGLRGPDKRASAPSDFTRLMEAGVISDGQRRVLARLNRVRNSIQHSYGLDAKPDEIYAGAVSAIKVLNAFIADYGDWLRSVGILPPVK